jgi:TM2 domain-containing membrane protein YozV
MMITNWFGVFTVLLASHLIVYAFAWIAGNESGYRSDTKVSSRMSREWVMRNHPTNNKGEWK